jgi:hypothetical protein
MLLRLKQPANFWYPDCTSTTWSPCGSDQVVAIVGIDARSARRVTLAAINSLEVSLATIISAAAAGLRIGLDRKQASSCR